MKIQAVFPTLEPYRIARDLGLTITDTDGKVSIPHPTLSGRRIWLVDKEFVSLQDGCPFVAGDVFDFLAFHLGNYELAVDHVLKTYGDQSTAQGQALETLRPIFIQMLSQDRAFFMGVLALRDQLDQTGSHFTVKSWLSKLGCSPRFARNLVYAAPGADLNNLLSRLAKAPSFEKKSYAVMPYFSNYHTVASLRVVDLERKEAKNFETAVARRSFFGLHTVSPASDDVRVLDTPECGISHYAYGRAAGNDGLGVLHPQFSNVVHADQMHFQTGTFVLEPTSEVATVARCRSVFRQFYVSGEVDARASLGIPPRQPWSVFALAFFKDALVTDGDITPRVAAIYNDLEHDSDTGAQVLEMLKPLQRPDWINQLRARSSIKQTYYMGETEIEESPAGYLSRRSGSNQSTLGTNFTIRLRHSVWFDESDEIFHFGVVVHNGTEYPLCLSREEFSKSNKLVTAITAAQHKFTPIFYSNSIKQHILNVLSEQSNRYAAHEGVRHLGWNAKRTAFRTPTWQVTISGVTTDPKVGHPRCKVLQDHYQFQYIPPTVKGTLPSAIQPYLALLASMHVRLMTGRGCPVVTLQNNAAGLRLLKAMFLPLGQTKPVELNVNNRKEVNLVAEELERYVVFGNVPSEMNITGRSGYVFALSKTGPIFSYVIDDDLFDQIYAHVYTIHTQLTLKLLRDRGSMESLLGENPKEIADYESEGIRILNSYCPHSK